MDYDRNGFISFEELYTALKNGQPSSEFSRDTVKLLLNKYDNNSDNQISFKEFHDLFIGINEQFNDFIDIDTDFSGSIDINELAQYFRTKGFNFNPNFYRFVMETISKRTGRADVNFDIYLKIRGRFDQLNAEYQRTGTRNESKEFFFGKKFFLHF